MHRKFAVASFTVIAVFALANFEEARAGVGLADRVSALSARIASVSRDVRPGAGPNAVAPLAELYRSRARLHRTRENWDLALTDLESAARAKPDLQNLDLDWGETLLGAKRSHEALVFLKRHVETVDNDPSAWLSIAQAYMDLELHAHATDAYSRAIEHSLHPSPDLFLARADALESQGPDHFARALDSVEQGIAVIGPAISLELRALALERRLGKFERALYRVSVHEARAQSRAPWKLRRGEILLDAERPDQARAALNDARSLAINIPLSRRNSEINRELIEKIDVLLALAGEN